MVEVGDYAPELEVSEWLQGEPKSIEDLRGKKPVFLHMFQVNCLGCFLNGLPYANELEKKYGEKMEVIGLASRFEEFRQNSKKNFKDFLNYGKLTTWVGGAMKLFGETKYLKDDDTYKIKINHSVGWDKGKVGGYSKTWENYGARGTPYEYLIDKEGKVLAYDFSLKDNPVMKDFLKTL